MKRKLIFITIACAICIAGIAPEIASNGAPISSTGAPNEGSCGSIGCHDDTPANNGIAISSIIFNNGITEYFPGETYSITIRIEESGIQRFGYQLLALKNSDESNCGTFKITDSVRTQIMANSVNPQLLDRRYATYLYPGTSPVSSGVGEWTINWTAPNSDIGNITFYYATLAGDDDGSDLGDEYYLNSLVITPSTTLDAGSIKKNDNLPILYPNPTTGLLNIGFPSTDISSVEVYDISGRLVGRFDEFESGQTKVNIGNMTNGNYIVKIKQNSGNISKQVTLKK